MFCLKRPRFGRNPFFRSFFFSLLLPRTLILYLFISFSSDPFPFLPTNTNPRLLAKTRTNMPAQFLASHPDVTLAAAQRIAALAPYLTPSVTINLGLGGYHLMMGLLLGVVKYQQIHASKTYTAHPYISTGMVLLM